MIDLNMKHDRLAADLTILDILLAAAGSIYVGVKRFATVRAGYRS
jgi:hypothetical protein